MTRIKLASTGWTLNVLRYDEKSPMERHHDQELAADDTTCEIWASALLVMTYGTDSVIASCVAYANKRNAAAVKS